LNGTATHVWKLAERGCTAEEAAASLAEHFEVSREQALKDLQVCLADLVARQVLTVK
jgi:hypothetical protein